MPQSGTNRAFRPQNVFWNRRHRRPGASAGVEERAPRPRVHVTRSVRPGHGPGKGGAGPAGVGPGVGGGAPRPPRLTTRNTLAPSRATPGANRAPHTVWGIWRGEKDAWMAIAWRFHHAGRQTPLLMSDVRPVARRPAGAHKRGTSPAAPPPGPRATGLTASRAGEPPGSGRRRQPRRPRTRPAADNAAGGAALLRRRRPPPCAPVARRPAGAHKRGTSPAAHPPGPRGARRPASSAREPPSSGRCRRPRTRPPPDSAAARAADLRRRRNPLPHPADPPPGCGDSAAQPGPMCQGAAAPG